MFYLFSFTCDSSGVLINLINIFYKHTIPSELFDFFGITNLQTFQMLGAFKSKQYIKSQNIDKSPNSKKNSCFLYQIII
jgi:hypothetical protein